MKIYDISQEVFHCSVFPGDTQPERIRLEEIRLGAACNLTGFRMCAHNGTHVDAPYHFLEDGNPIDRVTLDRFVGPAYVCAFEGPITARDASEILKRARSADEHGDPEDTASERILVKGNAVMTEEGAEVFAQARIKLYGNESQTVGPVDAPMTVHRIMLGAEIVLLEGIRLGQVPEGVYLLNAAPLNLGGADGAPCRAILMKES